MTVVHKTIFSDERIQTLYNQPYMRDWPVVYLLVNGREAYIGETVSAYARFKQHIKNENRKTLKNAYIVIDEEYNKSASLDIESSLIQYMAADQKYILQNSNKGLSDHSYYDREKYRAKFEILWKELQAKGVVNHDLIQLRNSDIFKYSPYKSLTQEQMDIVKIVESDLSNLRYKTYLVNGDPGTGKSVLATYLTKYLIESENMRTDIKIALVIPMVNLRNTLKRVFRTVKGLSPSMVVGPSEVVGNHYDLLIVDEAHRLRQRKNLTAYKSFDEANSYFGLGDNGTQLDWIMKSSKSQVFLYDENQNVMPGDIPPSTIQHLDAEIFHLTSQLRVNGGDDYIKFVDDLLNLRPIQATNFGSYDLRYFDSAEELIDEIKKRDSESGLSRVVAGYAWDWKTKTGSGSYDIEIDGLRLVWNSTNVDWVNSANALNEVGCIHTIQGYDLNYVGVIIGPEFKYDRSNNKLIIDKDRYRDINGKRSVNSPDELSRYIVNIYKTLLTRGILGTYVYAVDDELGGYIRTTLSKLT